MSQSSSSDEDFIVSSDEETSSNDQDEDLYDQDIEILKVRHSKSQKTASHSGSHAISMSSNPTTTNVTNLSSLSKLLLLNGASLSSIPPAPINAHKPALVPIQPKPVANTNEVYQVRIEKLEYNKQDYFLFVLVV